MSFEGFVKDVVMELDKRLPGFVVGFGDAERNGEIVRAFMVTNDRKITMRINADELYESYANKSAGLQEIIGYILDAVDEMQVFDMSGVEDWNKIKDLLFFDMMPYDKKASSEVPCDVIVNGNGNGIMVVVRMLFGMDGYENGVLAKTGIVRNALLDKLGVSKEQLFEAAKESGPKIVKPVIESLDEWAKGTPFGDGVLVLSNENRVYGAGGIFYPEVVSKIQSRFFGCRDFLILPSSRHELIIMPDYEDLDYDVYREMTRTINAFCVDQDDILSDDLLRYDGKKGVVEVL